MSFQYKKISGIILAAGRSERMNRVKQLLPFRDRTILGQVVENALSSSLDEVVVVLGHAAEQIRRSVDFGDAKVVFNEDFGLGQSASLQAGLAAITNENAAALFILGDQPLVGADIMDGIIERYQQHSARIVIPTYGGKRGNPVLIDRSVFSRLESLSGDVGARILFGEYAREIMEIEMGREDTVFDVDTWDDYLRLSEMESNNMDQWSEADAGNVKY